MSFKTTIYIILAIYQLFKSISREDLAADRIYLDLNEKVSSKHLYLNNALERSDLYYYPNLSII